MRLSCCGWALSALAVASVALLAPEVRADLVTLRGSDFPAALVAGAALAQTALSGWVLTIVAASLLGDSSRLVRVVTPRLLRRALFVSAATALSVAPAHADQPASPSGSSEHQLTGLRLPDRPDAARRPRTTPPPATNDVVVVRAGDTLWAIAARSLPADASTAQVAEACSRWHAANRSVIGDDPDLIFPAQRLVPPLGKDTP